MERQECIYEFIMTEKQHCQNLLLIQKVFVESLERHFNLLNRDRLFPRLTDLTELHTGSVVLPFLHKYHYHIITINTWSQFNCSFFFSRIFPFASFHSNCRFLKKLRLKQRENYVVDSIADIMVDFFSNQSERLISAYGMLGKLRFCL